MYFVLIVVNADVTFFNLISCLKSYLDPKCVRKFKFCVSDLVKR